MFSRIAIIGSLFFMIVGNSLFAQDTLKILNSFVLIEVDTAQAHLPLGNLDSTIFCVKVFALFSDTSDIDSVHIRVGRTVSSQDVAAVDFAYNSATISPSLLGFVPYTQGFEVCVAPVAQNAYTLFLEIWADDKAGNTTPVHSMRIN